MRFIAVLNRDGGTLRTTDLDAFCGRMTETLETAGHRVDIERIDGQDVEAAIAKACGKPRRYPAGWWRRRHDLGCGRCLDGQEEGTGHPACRYDEPGRPGWRIPLSLDAAVEAFAIGRDQGDRYGKLQRSTFDPPTSRSGCTPRWSACARRWNCLTVGKDARLDQGELATALNPPSLKVSLTIGDTEMLTRATAISISNNLFGEGHLPYADQPDGGVLGIDVTVARDRGQVLRVLPRRGPRALARQSARRNPRRRKSCDEGVIATGQAPDASSTVNCCHWQTRRQWKFIRRR